jgi:hypothetical protein
MIPLINEISIDEGSRLTLLIIIGLIAAPIIVYISLITYKKWKLHKINEKRNVDDEAYNTIHSTRAIANMMKNRGHNVNSIERQLENAQIAYGKGRYVEALELGLSAKRALIRIKEETPVEDKLSPHVKEELKYFVEEKEEEKQQPPEDGIAPVYKLQKKLPVNYLQSKFEIEKIENKINEVTDAQKKSKMKNYLEKAKKSFDEKEYTLSLKTILIAEKILNGEEIPVEQSSKKEQKQEDDDDILYCPQCHQQISSDDKFCANCGAEIILVFQCPYCNEEIKENDKFCRNCGQKLD